MSRVKTSTLSYALYKIVAIVGVVLFTVGLVLATMGPVARQTPYSEEIPVTKKLADSAVYLVAAEGFRYLYLNLSSGASVVGSFTVTSRGYINFYVMTRQQYEAWRDGRRASGLIVQKMVQSYNFSLAPPSDGGYYFLLDNSDSPVLKQVSISDIHSTSKQAVTKYRTVYDYTLPALGFISLIIGVVSTTVGLIKKPKPSPKESKKQPINSIGCIRLLSPYLFLLCMAVNVFFGALMVINWLKIEFYQYYSPRIIRLIIFSPAIDWWIWISSLILAFTIPYVMIKTSGIAIPKPVILSHLTLPLSLIFYLVHLQDLVTAILLIGSFSANYLSVAYSGELLHMPRVKALIVFLTGLFGILIPVELGSLFVWVRNTFDPMYPFGIDPRWRIPLIEVQLFNLLYPTIPWLLVAFLFSWIWVPAFKALRGK